MFVYIYRRKEIQRFNVTKANDSRVILIFAATSGFGSASKR